MTHLTLNLDPSGDNLFTAARRLRNYIRVDDAGGGLVSEKTVQASDLLSRHLEAIERQLKALALAQKEGDPAEPRLPDSDPRLPG